MASDMLDKQTKKMLVDTIIELSKKIPMDKITVAEVCRACGVSRNTFYYHFDDVYDAANWWLGQEREKIDYDEINDWDSFVEKNLELANRNILLSRMTLKSKNLHRTIAYYDDFLKKFIRRHIQESLSDPADISGKDLDLLVDIWEPAVMDIFLRWIAGDIKCPLDEIEFFLKNAVGSAMTESVKAYIKK